MMASPKASTLVTPKTSDPGCGLVRIRIAEKKLIQDTSDN